MCGNEVKKDFEFTTFSIIHLNSGYTLYMLSHMCSAHTLSMAYETKTYECVPQRKGPVQVWQVYDGMCGNEVKKDIEFTI